MPQFGMWKYPQCGVTNFFKGVSCLCGQPEPDLLTQADARMAVENDIKGEDDMERDRR